MASFANDKLEDSRARLVRHGHLETCGVKRDKAVAKLVKDRDALLTFYEFPAEH